MRVSIRRKKERRPLYVYAKRGMRSKKKTRKGAGFTTSLCVFFYHGREFCHELAAELIRVYVFFF